MIVTLITDKQPYIFEDVTYISVDRDGTLFHVEHAEDFVLEDTITTKKVDVNKLTERLNIGLECATCPRYTGYRGMDKCRGHLTWLCGAINELVERTNDYYGEKGNNR